MAGECANGCMNDWVSECVSEFSQKVLGIYCYTCICVYPSIFVCALANVHRKCWDLCLMSLRSLASIQSSSKSHCLFTIKDRHPVFQDDLGRNCTTSCLTVFATNLSMLLFCYGELGICKHGRKDPRSSNDPWLLKQDSTASKTAVSRGRPLAEP